MWPLHYFGVYVLCRSSIQSLIIPRDPYVYYPDDEDPFKYLNFYNPFEDIFYSQTPIRSTLHVVLVTLVGWLVFIPPTVSLMLAFIQSKIRHNVIDKEIKELTLTGAHRDVRRRNKARGFIKVENKVGGGVIFDDD